MKFALTKDFESSNGKVQKSDKSLELIKLTKDEYLLLEHIGDLVSEIATLSKEELRTLWIILTTKE